MKLEKSEGKVGRGDQLRRYECREVKRKGRKETEDDAKKEHENKTKQEKTKGKKDIENDKMMKRRRGTMQIGGTKPRRKRAKEKK